jgi:hypothetical protein
MAVRPIEQAEREFAAYFDCMRKAVSAANAHLWRTYADDMHRTSRRSRANMLCDWIGDELGKELIGKSGIQSINTYGVPSFAIDQNWLIRVHKMDEGGTVATNNTQLRLSLDENDLAQVSLFGLPDSATVVYLGYVENVASPLNPEVWLICPDGENPAWEILLGTVEPPAPIELPPQLERPDETRIIPKRADRNEAGEE